MIMQQQCINQRLNKEQKIFLKGIKWLTTLPTCVISDNLLHVINIHNISSTRFQFYINLLCRCFPLISKDPVNKQQFRLLLKSVPI